MMDYTQNQVMDAFQIYALLAGTGEIRRDAARPYFEDDTVRDLLEKFAQTVQCTIVSDRENIYLLPIAQISSFHISNDALKRLYMPARALNLDIYMMYLVIIVLFGKFYDSYQSMEPLDFVPMDAWLKDMNERVEALKTYDDQTLKNMDREYDFNWTRLLQKWEDMDDLKETVKRQDSRTVSRLSLLNIAKSFLEKQNLLIDIGNDEVQLTEKAKTIIQRYYMQDEYNRGILAFIYQYENQGGASNAGNQ